MRIAVAWNGTGDRAVHPQRMPEATALCVVHGLTQGVPEGTAMLESARFRSDLPDALEADGFHVVHHDAFSRFHGCVQLVIHRHDEFIGVAGPRRDGTAGGPKT